MVLEQDSRSAMLLGEQAMEKLKNAHVAVFGIGGVGGHLCEALARVGVGKLTLVDSDTVSVSNINRQIVALHSTVGKPKVDVMRERILDINPSCSVTVYPKFYLPENADEFPLAHYDYIADAIDTVSAKIELTVRAQALGIPIIAAMGAGNRTDPTRFAVSDLFKTQGCPLARVMRRELKARGIRHLKVVFSDEPAMQPSKAAGEEKRVPGSLSFVPSVVGLIMAREIVFDLIGQ